MMEPILFTPVYKEIIWGGKNIASYFSRATPFEKTAESWELCERPEGMSVAAGGAYAGRSLSDLIGEYGSALLGTRCVEKYGLRCPLLIKLIDANDRLSVQVHPNDRYARLHGEENGKNEMWYIVDAKPGAKLVYGLAEGVTKEAFAKAVREEKVGETLRTVPVTAGDALFIPAGTVHAILDGILIAEIQQNSNTTYRIYDWGRVGADGASRALHIAQSLEVISFGAAPPVLPKNGGAAGGAPARRPLVRSEFFQVDESTAAGGFSDETTGDSFQVLMNLGAAAVLSFDGGEIPVPKGGTVLIPATLGRYNLKGNGKVLTAWI